MADLLADMQEAADKAARDAAGRVFADHLAATHPGPPPVEWWATLRRDWDAPGRVERWHAVGFVSYAEHGEAKVREIVAAYADALGGTPPREVDRGVAGGTEIETTATLDGADVVVWGVVGYP